MAEAQKKDSSSVGAKEKMSLLDMDIGKDFFSNWKPMSMAEGDEMDFDLTPAPKGNKKSFNFDNADLDFNLDDDFGKMSSFKMDMSDLDMSPPLKKDGKSKEKAKESFNTDMSDLDISPPLKKDGKSKEEPKETSSGKDKGKSDHFGFEFDFDEMDNFSFEPNLTKEGSKGMKDKDNKETSAKESAPPDKESSVNMNLIGNMSTLEDRPQRTSLPEPMIPFDMDCQRGEIADLHPKSKYFTSKLAMDGAVTSKHSAAIDEVTSDKAMAPPELTSASRELTRTSESEKLISVKPIEREARTADNGMKDLSSDSISNNEPSREISSEVQEKLGSVSKIATASNGERDVNGSTSNYNHTVSENSQLLQTVAISEKNNGEKSLEGAECQVVDNKYNKERTDLGPVNPHVEISCTTSAVSGMLSNTISSLKNREPASEILKLPLDSQPADPFLLEKESERGRKAQVTCSKFFIQSEKPGCPVQKALTQATVSSLSSKKMGFRENSLHEGRRDWTNIQSDKKLASLPMQHPKTLLRRELPPVQSQESCKSLNISREGRNSDGLENRTKMNDSSTTQNKDLMKRNDMRQIETSAKDVDTLREVGNGDVVENRTDLKDSSKTQNKDMVRRTALRQIETNVKDTDTLREVSNSNGLENRVKLTYSSTTQTKDILKGTALRQIETNVKDVDTLSSSMDINKKTPKNNGNATTLASLQTIKNNLPEEDQISSLGGGGTTLDLRGLKLSKLNLDSTKSPIRKDVKPVESISRNTVLLRNSGVNTPFFALLQKQSPSTLSMKRKASEEHTANAVLHPSKRPFQSPTTSRNSGETSPMVFDKKLPNHSNIKDDGIKGTVGNSLASTYDIPHQMKINEVEISFSIENDSNIRQAEAYTKELDDLCNMLKKKQEEAKEILAQAIVNSNKLLILNYPLLEEKIRATQNLFAGLNLNSAHG